MAPLIQESEEPRILESRRPPTLFQALSRHGYVVIGPTVRDGAIVLDHMQHPDELPKGWTDEQSAGQDYDSAVQIIAFDRDVFLFLG